MKKIIIITVICLLSMAGYTQSVYFPSQEGMTLEYADKNAKGKATGYVTYHIRKIDKQNDNNFSVSYLISTFDDKHNELVSGIEVNIQVTDGTVHFDGSSLVTSLSKDIKIEGNGIIIPSDIHVGKKLEDFTITIESLATINSCTNVTVASQEELVTEAGTFNTYRIDMNLDAKALFIKVEGTTSQWYAKGIGEVKTINYNKKGKITSVRELVKLVK